jgi:hypothetical protein
VPAFSAAFSRPLQPVKASATRRTTNRYRMLDIFTKTSLR